MATCVEAPNAGLTSYFTGKIAELELSVRDRTQNLRRLEAQRNELNTKGAPAPPRRAARRSAPRRRASRTSRCISTKAWAPPGRHETTRARRAEGRISRGPRQP